MEFFEVMLDPANVFKRREGGIDWTGAIDPGGTIIEVSDPSWRDESWYNGSEAMEYAPTSSNFQSGGQQPTIHKTGPTPGSLVSGSARDTQAALARAEWNDYKNRFFPLEENLINRYDNANLRNMAMAENHNATNTAFDVDRGVQARRLSRYGTSLSADQQAAQDRENQVSRVAALTDVRNLTRDAYSDIDQQILFGSSSSNSNAIRTGE